MWRTEEQKGLDAAEFMRRSVTARTHKDYVKSKAVLEEYRSSLQPEEDPGGYFEACTTGSQRVLELVLFIKYLYESKGLREAAVSALITGLCYCFDLEGRDGTFLRSGAVSRAVRACATNPEETRAINEKKLAREKDPVDFAIIRRVRSLYWEERSWVVNKDLDARGSWLAVALGFDNGSRIGNVTKRDGKDSVDHCIRTKDIAVELTTQSGTLVKLKGSEALRLEIAKGHLDPKAAVTRAWLILYSSKTVRSVKTQLVPKLIERRTALESQLLDDLVEWLLYSGTMDEDELLTRYDQRGLRRSTTRKDATSALKAGALAEGHDPSRYSSKSLRGGFSTAAKEAGMPSDEINSRGGWAPGSKTPQVFYTTSKDGGNRGGMAIHSELDLCQQATTQASIILGPNLERSRADTIGGKAWPTKAGAYLREGS